MRFSILKTNTQVSNHYEVNQIIRTEFDNIKLLPKVCFTKEKFEIFLSPQNISRSKLSSNSWDQSERISDISYSKTTFHLFPLNIKPHFSLLHLN